MLSDHQQVVRLRYGADGQFECRRDASLVSASHSPPRAVDDFAAAVAEALAAPLDFPPLSRCVYPGDRVTVVLDRHTPGGATILAEIWRILAEREITPEDVTILQPVALDGNRLTDPRRGLPDAVRDRITWKVHDPTDEEARQYLATTTVGDRVYLAREVVDADFVLPVGQIAFDPLIGYRGTSSTLYPGLSTPEALSRAHGQGHSELVPDNERPLRQVMDEISWLLGIQFSLQVIAASRDEVSHVLAGASEAVYRRGKELLTADWLVQLESRAPLVIAAVDVDSSGHTWSQIGAAVAAAQNLVERGGKIVILSQLSAELGEGLKLLMHSESPREALKPLQSLFPPDLLPATQLAMAADWANLYLLSGLDDDVVDDLFVTPLGSESEVHRLLESAQGCVFLGGAQHTFGWVASR